MFYLLSHRCNSCFALVKKKMLSLAVSVRLSFCRLVELSATQQAGAVQCSALIAVSASSLKGGCDVMSCDVEAVERQRIGYLSRSTKH